MPLDSRYTNEKDKNLQAYLAQIDHD
jgi:hypothetical protein